MYRHTATDAFAVTRTVTILRGLPARGVLIVPCEYLDSCVFLANTARLDPFTAESVQTIYCQDDEYECVRFCLSRVLDLDDIPDHLWPNDETVAMEAIKFKLRIRHQAELQST